MVRWVFGSILIRISLQLGSSTWRAGFSGTPNPYIDRTNIVARYKERRFGRNVVLFGRDVEADANSRSSTRQMFDGDLLVHGDVLVSCTMSHAVSQAD